MEVTYNKNKLPDLVGAGDLIVGSYNSNGMLIKERGVAADSSDTARLQKIFAESLTRAGATMLPTAPKVKTKPVKAKQVKRIKASKTGPFSGGMPENEVRGVELVDGEAPPFNFFQEVIAPVDEEIITRKSPMDKAADIVALEDELEDLRAKRPQKAKKKVEFSNDFGKMRMQVEEVLECEMAYALVFANEDDIVFTPKPGQTLIFKNDRGVDSFVYYPDALFTLPDGSKKLMILFKSAATEDNE